MPRRQVLASPSRSGRWRGLRGGAVRLTRTILQSAATAMAKGTLEQSSADLAIANGF